MRGAAGALEIWTDTQGGLERAALTDGRALLGLAVAPCARPDQPGAVSTARLQKRDAREGGAGEGRKTGGGFVTCALGRSTVTGFADRLPEPLPAPFLVQIVTPARKTAFADKAARVTTDITLPGFRVLYHPAAKTNGAVAWSRRTVLPAKARDEIAASFKAALPSGMCPGGWTLRRTLQPDEIDLAVTEAKGLAALWSEHLSLSSQKISPWPAPPSAFRLLAGEDAFAVRRIVAQTQADAKRLADWRKATAYGWGGEIAVAPRMAHGNLTLFERAGFDEAISALREPVVTLKSGSSLVIEATEAMTVIDVNSGNASTQDHVALAREALREIARQIRLRNIGGTIVIDALVPDHAAGRARMLADMRAIVAEDPAGVEVFGISRLGLIEMTRKRQGWPLAAES